MSRRLLMVLLCGAAVGCGEPVPENDQPVVRKKAAPAPAAEVADEGPAAEAYYYNPAGKRDPFQSFISQSGRAEEGMAQDAPPLQRWDVDKFTLRGIIWETTSPSALLLDPDGIGHVVRIGSYVGRNWGKVTSITQDGLVVTEEYETIDGELVVNPVNVHFPGSEKK